MYKRHLKIAILGGGPSGLLMFKQLIRSGKTTIAVDIFEKSQYLGSGMPYSEEGATDEHITNVSSNEIPEMCTTLAEWIKTADKGLLGRFDIDPEKFHEYKTLPRLLFGHYLSDQFLALIDEARAKGIAVTLRMGTIVTDIDDAPTDDEVIISTSNGEFFTFERVIICTGHHWPKKWEGKIEGYYDSPYPPVKLAKSFNHPIGIKGSSLTAIDAIRTLARANGQFIKDEQGDLTYNCNEENPNFKMLMHSRNGLLPAVRFHLKEPYPAKETALSKTEVNAIRKANDGFLPLDDVYRRCFVEPLKKEQPEFYEKIKALSMEDFVDEMMLRRTDAPPFRLLAAEYVEAMRSIAQEKPVYWKEMLAVLSFAMNYPAKYFSAEDMQRLKKTLMPLVSVVIAFTPQRSVEEMLALHASGVLDIIAVGEESEIKVNEDTGGAVYVYTDEEGDRVANCYETFIDAVGQPHLSYNELPYRTLAAQNVITAALIAFRDQEQAAEQFATGDDSIVQQDDKYFLRVPGVKINDNFQLVNAEGSVNHRIYMMAVPYIGGYNPDYSGLDFGEIASLKIMERVFD